MQFHAFFKNKFYWIVKIFIFLFIGLFIFTLFNEKFYQMPIGKVTDVQRVNTQHVTDEQHNKDIKYKDRLTIQILNGKFEGAK